MPARGSRRPRHWSGREPVRVRIFGECWPELRHVGLHGSHAVVAGDGDAVVAVLYEVGVAKLVEAHRRKHLVLVVGQIHTLPPLPCPRTEGHEAAVEVLAASHAPDDLLRIHDPYPPADLVVRPQRPSDL